MSEELDQAAEAFLPEITPEPVKPRDQAGRFVETAAKPEPMFAERPVEGLEDAGDDPATAQQRKGGQRGSDQRDVRDPSPRVQAGLGIGSSNPPMKVRAENLAPMSSPRSRSGASSGGKLPTKAKNTKSSSMGSRSRCP